MDDSVEFYDVLASDAAHQAYIESLSGAELLAYETAVRFGRMAWKLEETRGELDDLKHEAERLFDELTDTRSLLKDTEERNRLLTFTESALRRLLPPYQEVQRLEEAARKDDLTGIYNRKGLAFVYEGLVAGRRSNDTHEDSIMFLDLDNFKEINDVHGYPYGDDVLRFVAQFLAAELRSRDFIGRWGGDEFVIILPATSLGQSLCVANKLKKKLKAVNTLREVPISLSFSMGIDCVNPSLEFSQSYDRASEAMRRAKQAGRDKVLVVEQA